MAWIEAHQQLLNHPKTLDLMAIMEWDLDTTIAKLLRFWWWCVDYAENGDLRKHSPERLAGAVGLKSSDGQAFFHAMIKSGWIDEEPHLRVHDWWDYIGPFLRTKYRHHPDRWHKIKDMYVKDTVKDDVEDPVTKPNLTLPNLTNNNPPEAAFSEGFIKKAEEAKAKGFNIYQLSNRFYKESKMLGKLPEGVLMAVLDEFVQRGANVRDYWPYFLKVLNNKSSNFHAEKNVKEGEDFKKSRNFAPSIAEILAGMK